MGAAVGFAVVFATMVFLRVTGKNFVPPPPFVITAVISGLCFWSAFKVKSG